MKFRKMIMMILYVRQQKRHRYKGQTVGKGKGGMIWENSIETCILPYVKQLAIPGSMHGTGCLGRVHWDDPEDGMGIEMGGGCRMGNTCTPMADSCQCMAKPLQYYKVISLQLKWINLFKKRERERENILWMKMNQSIIGIITYYF